VLGSGCKKIQYSCVKFKIGSDYIKTGDTVKFTYKGPSASVYFWDFEDIEKGLNGGCEIIGYGVQQLEIYRGDDIYVRFDSIGNYYCSLCVTGENLHGDYNETITVHEK
jgi:plastocyanin